MPLDGSARHVEGLCDLGLGLVQVVTQDEELPLAAWQLEDRAPEPVGLVVLDRVVLGRCELLRARDQTQQCCRGTTSVAELVATAIDDGPCPRILDTGCV
jgi:hypothetical protein